MIYKCNVRFNVNCSDISIAASRMFDLPFIPWAGMGLNFSDQEPSDLEIMSVTWRVKEQIFELLTEEQSDPRPSKDFMSDFSEWSFE